MRRHPAKGGARDGARSELPIAPRAGPSASPPSATCEPASCAAASGYVAWPKALDVHVFSDSKGAERGLTATEKEVIRCLLGRLRPGEVEVNSLTPEDDPRPGLKGLRQDRLALDLGITDRHLRRLMKALELAGLLQWTLIRDNARRIRATQYDLSGALSLLPLRTQKYRRIDEILRTKMSGRSESKKGGQVKFEFDPVLEENTVQTMPKVGVDDAESARTLQSDVTVTDPTYRTTMSGRDQESSMQAMLAEQHRLEPVADAILETTGDIRRRVVARLIDAGMGKQRAWTCVRTKGPEQCLDHLGSMRFERSVRNPGAWLAEAILKEFALHPKYLAQRDRVKINREEQLRQEAKRAVQAARNDDIATSLTRRDEALRALSASEFAALVEETKRRFAGRHDPASRSICEWSPNAAVSQARLNIVHTELYKTLQQRDQRGQRVVKRDNLHVGAVA